MPFSWVGQGSGINSSGNKIIQDKRVEVEEVGWDLSCEYGERAK